MDSKQKTDYNCELCTIYSSNNHHNIVANVTSPSKTKQKKNTVNPTHSKSTVQQRGKSAREPKETEAVHSHFTPSSALTKFHTSKV